MATRLRVNTSSSTQRSYCSLLLGLFLLFKSIFCKLFKNVLHQFAFAKTFLITRWDIPHCAFKGSLTLIFSWVVYYFPPYVRKKKTDDRHHHQRKETKNKTKKHPHTEDVIFNVQSRDVLKAAGLLVQEARQQLPPAGHSVLRVVGRRLLSQSDKMPRCHRRWAHPTAPPHHHPHPPHPWLPCQKVTCGRSHCLTVQGRSAGRSQKVTEALNTDEVMLYQRKRSQAVI